MSLSPLHGQQEGDLSRCWLEFEAKRRSAYGYTHETCRKEALAKNLGLVERICSCDLHGSRRHSAGRTINGAPGARAVRLQNYINPIAIFSRLALTGHRAPNLSQVAQRFRPHDRQRRNDGRTAHRDCQFRRTTAWRQARHHSRARIDKEPGQGSVGWIKASHRHARPICGSRQNSRPIAGWLRFLTLIKLFCRPPRWGGCDAVPMKPRRQAARNRSGPILPRSNGGTVTQEIANPPGRDSHR